MTKVYLVRHGETDYSQNGIVQGQLDICLNKLGIQTAEKLGDYISKNYIIDTIVTSDLIRCVKTSEIINSKLPNNPAFEKSACIREVKLGIYEGKEMSQLEIVRYNSNDYNSFIPCKGESMKQMSERVLKWFYANYSKMNNVLIVSHRGPMSALLDKAKNISNYNLNELLLQRKIIELRLNSDESFQIENIVEV